MTPHSSGRPRRPHAGVVVALLLTLAATVVPGAHAQVDPREFAIRTDTSSATTLDVGPAVAAAPLDVTLFPPLEALPDSWPVLPAISAESWLLADLDTGQTLASRHADDPRPVASTVKILTALTVLRHADVDEEVLITPASVGVEGAGAGLVAGRTVTVGQLLGVLVARSANDAAIALGIHVGGDLPTFLGMMERLAADLGLDVRVADPAGLSQFTRMSARDLAVISRVAMSDPDFRTLAAAPAVARPDGVVEPSRNLLIGAYDGVTGIKTGFTSAAGGALVASAERDGVHLIAVILGATDITARFDDATSLLDLGFDQFDPIDVASDTTLFMPDPFAAGARGTILLPPSATAVVRSGAGFVADLPSTLRPIVEVDGIRVAELAAVELTSVADASPVTAGRWLAGRVQSAIRVGLAEATFTPER